MLKTKITETAKDAEELFKLIMNLYWTYITSLEEYIQSIPASETATFNEFTEHMLEVQAALEHDIGIFQKAINSDLEDLHQTTDQLKINDIYDKLQK